MSERDNLILAISDDNDWTFLELQAEDLALTKEQVVAMLIRKARKAYERPASSLPDVPTIPTDLTRTYEKEQTVWAEQAAKREAEEQRQREAEEQRARLQAELAELEGALASFDKPLARLDRVEAIGRNEDVPSLPEFDESLLRQPEPDPIRAAIIPSSAAPGSLTGPVGVRRDLRGGDVMGDAKNNILRRNYKHLGAG